MTRVARAALSIAALGIAALGTASCSSDGGSSGSNSGVPAGTDPVVATVSPLSESASSEPSDAPISEPVSTEAPSTGVEPEGFTTVMVEITKADGEVCEVCMWLADTSDERGRGLMGVTSLGTPEGMAFAWDAPTSGSFYMFHTVTPLSIAWFGGDGSLVSTTDMDPCLSENSADCERFPAGGEYVLAIEVFRGDLGSIGITDGATARLLLDTEAIDCPLA